MGELHLQRCQIERRSSCQLSLPLSLCCSAFAASLPQHEPSSRTVASSVGINNKPAPKIIPERPVRLNTTYALSPANENSQIVSRKSGEASLLAEKKMRREGLFPLQGRARAADRQGKAMMKRVLTLAMAMASVPAMTLAQNARPQAPSYCFDLSRVVDLAVTKERFASIAGRPRQGDFRDAKSPDSARIPSCLGKR